MVQTLKIKFVDEKQAIAEDNNGKTFECSNISNSWKCTTLTKSFEGATNEVFLVGTNGTKPEILHRLKRYQITSAEIPKSNLKALLHFHPLAIPFERGSPQRLCGVEVNPTSFLELPQPSRSPETKTKPVM